MSDGRAYQNGVFVTPGWWSALGRFKSRATDREIVKVEEDRSVKRVGDDREFNISDFKNYLRVSEAGLTQ